MLGGIDPCIFILQKIPFKTSLAKSRMATGIGMFALRQESVKMLDILFMFEPSLLVFCFMPPVFVSVFGTELAFVSFLHLLFLFSCL